MGSCYSTASTGERNKKKSTSCKVDEEEEAAVTTSAAAGNRWWKSNKKSRPGGYEENDGENGQGDGSVIHHHRHQTPMNGMTRMWLNGANNTETACLYTQQGKKGINQDAMLVWENFSSRTDTVFCGVFDGHGPFGHMVSKKVRDSLPLLLCTHWESDSGDGKISLYKNENALGNMNSEETISASLDDEWYDSLEGEENERLPKVFLSIKKAMLKAFKLMDKELKLHPTIDCFCSGTTAVTLIKQGQDLVIGNVGDSRAVLATRDKDSALLAIQLTVDLKPDLPREAARIQQCKGRVFALQDEPEVARVWLPDSDSPGLAMARAFGDFCLKDFGLISIPEIYYYHLTTRDEFIILATDGVWDVLSNKEAVDIVAAAPGRATAARALVECAVRAWRLKYPTSKNDDCAVVCLFLEHSDALNSNVEECNAQKNSQLADRDTMTSVNAAELDLPVESDVALVHSCASQGPDEIVPVSNFPEEKVWAKSHLQSNKTLAECILSSEDEEWSALEGITRVNSLLSIPRFLSRDKREASWRKG